MILVTGGCRSGKSEYGEELAAAMGEKKLYIATGRIFDKELERRVEKHRQRRGPLWTTHEGYSHLEDLDYNGYGAILLDSVTAMATNLFFDEVGESTDYEAVDYETVEKHILAVFVQLAERVLENKIPMIMVTDEIGLGVVPGTPLGRGFRDILGQVNQYLAKSAEEVYLVISGIPVRIKPQ